MWLAANRLNRWALLLHLQASGCRYPYKMCRHPDGLVRTCIPVSCKHQLRSRISRHLFRVSILVQSVTSNIDEDVRWVTIWTTQLQSSIWDKVAGIFSPLFTTHGSGRLIWHATHYHTSSLLIAYASTHGGCYWKPACFKYALGLFGCGVCVSNTETSSISSPG